MSNHWIQGLCLQKPKLDLLSESTEPLEHVSVTLEGKLELTVEGEEFVDDLFVGISGDVLDSQFLK